MLPVAVRLLARRDLARTCQDAPASWDADEERVDALVEEGEVVEREVASAKLLADGIEVEVEGVDGVDLGERGVLDAAVDGALRCGCACSSSQSRWRIVEVGEVVLGRPARAATGPARPSRAGAASAASGPAGRASRHRGSSDSSSGHGRCAGVAGHRGRDELVVERQVGLAKRDARRASGSPRRRGGADGVRPFLWRSTYSTYSAPTWPVFITSVDRARAWPARRRARRGRSGARSRDAQSDRRRRGS